MRNSVPASPGAHLRQDVFANVVVFLVALPLCLGIATASGVDPFAGLISGIIGCLVVSLLSGSRLSVSGPAAGLVVIVVSSIASLGSFSAFLAAVLIAGLLQIAFGFLKAGGLANFVPTAVIKGMLASIGLMLIMAQVPLGMALNAKESADAPGEASGMDLRAATFDTQFGEIGLISMVLFLVSLAILFIWDSTKRFKLVRAIPGPLAVVLLGIGGVVALDASGLSATLPDAQRVTLVSIDSFSALTSALAFPDFSQMIDADVWRVAITLAIVASLETLLSLEAVEQIDPERRRASPDRELKAQGVGNMTAAMLGGLPLTSVIVRSSANVNAGAKTRLSCVIHWLLLLASVVALTAVLNLIPLACLAAVLVHTGYKLAKPQLFISTAREGWQRFLPFIATIVGVMATDLLIGIGIGIATGAVIALRTKLAQTFTLTQHGDHYLLSFRKDATFLDKPMLTRQLDRIPDNATLIVDAECADFVDRDIREALEDFVSKAPDRGITVEQMTSYQRFAVMA